MNVRGEGAVDARHVEPVEDAAKVREIRERRLAGGSGAVRRYLIGGGESCREPLTHRDPDVVLAAAQRHQGGKGQSSQPMSSHDGLLLIRIRRELTRRMVKPRQAAQECQRSAMSGTCQRRVKNP